MSPLQHVVRDIPRRKFLEVGLKGGLAMAAAPSVIERLFAAGAPGALLAPPVQMDPAVLDRVIRKALEKGGEFADVYVETRTARSLLMEESKFKSAVLGISRGAGVRVILGDKTGYAYTDEITEDKLLRAAEVASFVARGGKAAKPVNVRTEARASFVTVKLPLGDVADEQRLDICRRANQAALDFDKRIRMASVSYYDEVRGRVIANSEGLYVTNELPLLFFIVQALSEGNNTRHMGRERLSRHSGFEMFDEVPPEQVARASRARGHRHARRHRRSVRQDGRRDAERLGRRARARGRRPPARRRRHCAEGWRLHRQARPEGREPRSSRWSTTAASRTPAARPVSTTRAPRGAATCSSRTASWSSS